MKHSSYLTSHELLIMQYAVLGTYPPNIEAPQDSINLQTTVQSAERPAGDARANSKKRNPLSLGCTHAERRMVINPSILLCGREKRIEIHATSFVVPTTLAH